jgi:hypothetical protein
MFQFEIEQEQRAVATKKRGVQVQRPCSCDKDERCKGLFVNTGSLELECVKVQNSSLEWLECEGGKCIFLFLKTFLFLTPFIFFFFFKSTFLTENQ